MSKENQSRIPTRGFTRIPMPGQIKPPSRPQQQSQSNLTHQQTFTTKLAKPGEVPHQFVRPSPVGVPTQKLTQFSKSSLTNLSRIIPRSFSSDKIGKESVASQLQRPTNLKKNLLIKKSQESILKCSSNMNMNELMVTKSMSAVPGTSRLFDEDDNQMLIDETIDLVGSEENVNRLTGGAMSQDGTVVLSNDTVTYNKLGSSDAINYSKPGNITYELRKRDGTFIKSPTISLDKSKTFALSQDMLNRKSINSCTFVGSASNLANNRVLPSPAESKTFALRKSIELLGEDFANTISPLEGACNWSTEDLANISMNSSQRRSLVLNSTMLNNRLIDVTPVRPVLCASPSGNQLNITQLLSISQNQTSDSNDSVTLVPTESKNLNETIGMDVDDSGDAEPEPLTDNSERGGVVHRNPETKSNVAPRQRYSFGLDLTECTLDCSIELCEVSSMSSTVQQEKSSPMSNVDKQGSFEIDESLGILTPDQMKEFLDSTTNNTHNTNNLELPLVSGHKLSHVHCRVDQTPSPEELPLDPVGVKTELSDELMGEQHHQQMQQSQNQEVSQTDTDSKTELTKSVTSKVSNSFITSITSITSLDTGYIGDGEMSRPASRGAADQSPSKEPKVQPNQNQNPIPPNVNWNAQPVHRRQDPMTDSDFFTESDADDIFHRADQRRAQVIDGQLYGPMLQGANVFINQQPQMEDSCMESSGVFTDIENRGDDDLIQRLEEHRDNVQMQIVNDMSPDVSTETISSSNTACSARKIITTVAPTQPQQSEEFINLVNASASSINTSVSSPSKCEDCIDTINLISDVSFGSTKSTINDSQNCGSSKNTNKNNSTIMKIIPATPKTKTTNSTTTTPSTLSGSHSKKTGSIGKKLLNNSRKHYSKNESNYGLKKHEMSRSGLAKVKLNKSGAKTGIASASACASNSSSAAGSSGLSDENQENKSPTSASAVVQATVNSAKKSLNGKWDAVMSKIAENKSIKKNFSEVKSKVTCGLLKRSSTAATAGALKSPPSNDNSFISLDSTAAKRSNNGTGGKRGRTFSKDSQQSSQSDLSYNDGSPKITSKNVTSRSAKKRDVRTISSSPSDLGPPSKTNGNGTPRLSNRTITPIQKRASPQNGSANNHIQELKGSPPAKKVVPRRVQTSTTTTTTTTTAQNVVKSPLKDHNRLVGPPTTNTTSSKTPSTNNSPRSSLKSNQSVSNRNGTMILDGLSISPKSNSKQNDLENNNNSSKLINKNSSNVTTNKKSPQLDQQKQQQQQLQAALQQQLDQQMREKQMTDLNNLVHANKGVEALGVLVQYLVFNLDAFSCPSLKKQHQKTTKELLDTRNYLDEIKLSCQSLEDKLADKEDYFQKRESELQELHRCEIMKVEKNFTDFEVKSRDQIESLERELSHKERVSKEKLETYIHESEIKLSFHEQELQAAKEREHDLLQRISALTCTENELREKVHTSELEYSERLHVAQMRERELTDKINLLTKQAEDNKIKYENEKLELEEKLNLSQDELTIIRTSRSLNASSASESFHSKTLNTSQSQLLQDEVESLRCVLELKQSEISDLRKQNHELQRSADGATVAHVRISGLESRVEDLQVQLQSMSEEKKELLHKIKQLQDSHSLEVKKGSRLSLHNEELQWRLKQNSEKYSMAISELSKSYHENSSFKNASFQEYQESKSNGSIIDCLGEDDCDGISPPTSPIIKGVVEKSDSVSWVLEMDDETPEALATRMVRRAGSFRSDKCSPSPVPKRQKCQNNTSIQQSASAASILRQNSEPSPQKLSPGNVRLRSKSVSTKTPEPPKKMTRSSNSGTKRLEIPTLRRDLSRSTPKKSAGEENEEEDPLIIDEASKDDFFLEEQELNDVIPFSRSRSSTFNASPAYEHFHRDKAPNFKKSRENRGLITCDTAVLATAQKQKNLKKLRRPKAGAGEALVSGSNSENDEEISESSTSSSTTSSTSCSATSSSPSSPSISSSHSVNIEDTLMRKIVARLHNGSENGVAVAGSSSRMELLTGNNTPMEVSWSEEGEPSESVA